MPQIRRTYTRTITREIIRIEPSGSIPVGRCPLCGHETVAALPETGTQICQTDEQNMADGPAAQPKQNEPSPLKKT